MAGRWPGSWTGCLKLSRCSGRRKMAAKRRRRRRAYLLQVHLDRAWCQAVYSPVATGLDREASSLLQFQETVLTTKS